MTDKIYYFPWVRKGLSNLIHERDVVIDGDEGVEAQALGRAQLEVVQKFSIESTSEETFEQSESHMVRLVSPCDITSVSAAAILKCAPNDGKDHYPIDFYPYIEFWEPDFLWRYSPLGVTDDKIRPWLALVVCREGNYKMANGPYGSYVTFSMENEEDFEETFIPASEAWKCAHAQGSAPSTADFCRLIALRGQKQLRDQTNYRVFLIPAYETGRLKGLGVEVSEIEKIKAQKASWEDNLEEQKRLHRRPLDFPVYYSWSYRTGLDSFDALVEQLMPFRSSKSSIRTDVTKMGEGLDYNLLDPVPERKSIGVPAATTLPMSEKEPPFPSAAGDEAILRERMKSLLDENPVFTENRALLDKDEREDMGKDDPLVVPPVYGAKHVMATSLDEKACAREGIEWLSQLNLSVQNRAAAGLGKRTVQLNQEDFMNRAWKQIEAVNALNMELYKELVSHNAHKLLGRKVIDKSASSEKYVATLMQYLSSIKNSTTANNLSLAKILEDSRIPTSFATATFRHLTDSMSRMVAGLDTDTIMENIVDKQLFFTAEKEPLMVSSADELNPYIKILYDKVLECSLDPLVRIENGHFADVSYNKSNNRIAAYSYDMVFPMDKKIFYMSLLCQNIMTTGQIEAAMQESVDNWNAPISWDIPEDPDKVIQYIYDHRLLDVCYTGKVYQDKEQKADLIAIPDELYNSLFGTRFHVTRLGQVAYIVPKDRIRQFAGTGLGIDLTNTDNSKAAFLFKGIHCLEDCFEYEIIDSNYTFLHDPSPGMYHQYLTPFDWMFGKTTPYRREKPKKGMTAEYLRSARYKPSYQAECYVLNYLSSYPDGLDIQLEYLNGSYIQSFDSLESYLVFIKQMQEQKGLISIRNIVALEDYVRRIKEKKTEKLDTSGAISEQSVNEIKEEFADREAYERMKDVAEGYYRKFFENSHDGEELRKGYIDDLLRSKYPVLAYPIFPEPTYYYLKQFSEKFILPCAEEQPENTVAMMETNEEFVEAYLCGMNTELAKEMLWREYPTDERGSYFRKFWDCETSDEDIMKDNFFDVKPLHLWKGNLGENHNESKTGLVIFSIKGDLLRSYPDTKVTLHRSIIRRQNQSFVVELDEKATLGNGILKPVLEAYLGEDIYIVGFKTSVREIIGDPRRNDGGYCLAFSEDVEDLNFYYQNQDQVGTAENSAAIAALFVDRPTTYGKHVTYFFNPEKH